MKERATICPSWFRNVVSVVQKWPSPSFVLRHGEIERRGDEVETDAVERLRSFSRQLTSVPDTQPEDTDEAPSA